MRVFAVNMKTDIERRTHILKECARHSLDVEIVDAVIGKNLTETEIKEKVSDFENSGFTRGEIGCSLSHINIYRKMIDEGIEIALILEDDADIKDTINEAMAEIETFDGKRRKPSIYLLTEAEKYIQNFKVPLKTVTLHKYHRGWYTQGYIINRECAEILAKHLYPIKNYADNWRYILFSTKINIHTVIPTIITTFKGMESTIGEDRNLAEKKKRIRYKKKIMFGKAFNIFSFLSYYILKIPFYRIKSVK
ncbi:MAG: glycosyltransferase family 25 protein [Deferribacteraceae bacterium]|nr:glycosyltransferase family 25 protein [Deferribacteraceae bacterium]